MAQQTTRIFPDGDYPQRLQNAYAAFQQAAEQESREMESGSRLAGEESIAERLANEYEEIKTKAEADAKKKRRVVTLRAVGRTTWRGLKEKHPPRVGDGVDEEIAKSDRMLGVNADDIEDDLVFASIMSPKFTSRADFDEWAGDLSQGEWNVLVQDAWKLVNIAQFDPKSLPLSATRSDGAN